jgi:hypothetical protein
MANISPEKPPKVNNTINAIENIMGISKLIDPRHMVATQLNTFTPVGTEINMVAYMKNNSPAKGIPVVNIWCAHTIKDKNAIDEVAYTIDE